MMGVTTLDIQHRLLTEVYAAFDDRPQPKFTFFSPLIGEKYDGELMVVGRAVNGWLDAFDIADCGTEEGRRAVIDGGVPDWDGSPMRWVTDHWGVNEKGVYNPKRSAFWRVIRQVLAGIGIEDADWASHIVWTNLYRVSPDDGGNPDTELCDAQFKAAVDLLRQELEAHRPKRVLFLTGWGWFQWFSEGLGFDVERLTEGQLVEAVGKIAGARVVVAKHPQGKPEREMVALFEEAWR